MSRGSQIILLSCQETSGLEGVQGRGREQPSWPGTARPSQGQADGLSEPHSGWGSVQGRSRCGFCKGTFPREQEAGSWGRGDGLPTPSQQQAWAAIWQPSLGSPCKCVPAQRSLRSPSCPFKATTSSEPEEAEDVAPTWPRVFVYAIFK